MKQYLDLCQDILDNGRFKMDRTGVGCYSVFGRQLRWDLAKGFPLLTTKKVFTRGLIEELLWFLRGDTNNEELVAKNVHIWDHWAIPETIYIGEAERRLDRNSSVTCSGDMYMSLDEHVRIINIVDDAEAHAEYDKYGVSDRRYATEVKGDLGPIYGKQWRNFGDVDQIANLIDDLKTRPFSRRHIVSAWNPPELPDESMSPQDNVRAGRMALAPCHTLFQFHVEHLTDDELLSVPEVQDATAFVAPEALSEYLELKIRSNDRYPKYRLSCQLYQRSADFPIGIPLNIASYALLTQLVAHCVGMVPGDFVHTFGDAHIYKNQVESLKEQLQREPRKLPVLVLNPEKRDIFDFTIDDIRIDGYDPHPAIKFPSPAV